MSFRLSQRALRLTRAGLFLLTTVGASNVGQLSGLGSGGYVHNGESGPLREAAQAWGSSARSRPITAGTPAGGPLLYTRGPAHGEQAPAVSLAFGDERPINIPFQLIDRRHREDVRALVDSPTILRRLPAGTFHTDRRTYEYLLDNLPLSSKLSGLLGFGRYRVTELPGGRLHGDDGRGVSGDFWVVYADAGKRVYLGEGSFDPWLLPKVSGKVVMAVEYKEVPPGPGSAWEGGQVIATRVDVYLRTNRFVGYIIDLLGETADKKLTKLISSAQLTSEKLSSEPHEVWGLMTSSGLFAPGELESFRLAILAPDPTTPRQPPP